MSDFRTVGVIGRRGDARVVPTMLELCRILVELQREVILDADSPELHGLPPQLKRLPRNELAAQCDLGVVVGGDGTLLSAARNLAPHGVPILGINQGRLGFMVDVRPEEMRETLDAVFSGDYLREDRLLLEGRIERGGNGSAAPASARFLAINDVVIRNQAEIRMLEFDTWLDGEFISQHRADGLIVASPTGSTAYALSGGGPVLHPSLDAIALVPICPHTLSDRPIVVSGRQVVRFVLRGAAGTEAMCTSDGQNSQSLMPGDSLEVRAAAVRLRLIHPNNYSYFSILRNKLQWGRGPVLAPE